MTKSGLEISDIHEEAFADRDTEESMAQKELHLDGPPVNESGFWLPLRTPLKYSSFGSGGQNAYLHYEKEEVHTRSPHDQMGYVSLDDRYLAPKNMQWQYVPMKSDTCFESTLNLPHVMVDDLSDHYAAYAELCFGSRCAGQQLSGHRGYTRIGAGDAARCCPGRGLVDGKCFDWAPGGVHHGQIGVGPWNHCTKQTNQNICEIAQISGESLEQCYISLAALDLPFKFLEWK